MPKQQENFEGKIQNEKQPESKILSTQEQYDLTSVKMDMLVSAIKQELANAAEKYTPEQKEKISKLLKNIIEDKQKMPDIQAQYTERKNTIHEETKSKLDNFAENTVEVAKYRLTKDVVDKKGVHSTDIHENNFEVYKKNGKYILEMNGSGILKNDIIAFDKAPSKAEIDLAIDKMIKSFSDKNINDKIEQFSIATEYNKNDHALNVGMIGGHKREQIGSNATIPDGNYGNTQTSVPTSSSGGREI